MCPNVHEIGVPIEERDEGDRKYVWRNNEKNSNLIKIINSYIQETQWTLSTGNMKKAIPGHSRVKLLKNQW